jgi:hypothetical protein
LVRFRSRGIVNGFGPDLRPEFQSDLNDIFDEIYFMIDGAATSIFTGRPSNVVFGLTGPVPWEGTLGIKLALEAIVPLLQTNLSAAERLLDECRISSILLHELSVGIPNVENICFPFASLTT